MHINTLIYTYSDIHKHKYKHTHIYIHIPAYIHGNTHRHIET